MSGSMNQKTLRNGLRLSTLAICLCALIQLGSAYAEDHPRGLDRGLDRDPVTEPFKGSLTLDQIMASPNPTHIQGSLITTDDRIFQLETDPFHVQFPLLGPTWLVALSLENRLIPTEQVEDRNPLQVYWRVDRLRLRVFGMPVWEQDWPHCQSSQPLSIATLLYSRSLTASMSLNNFSGCGRFGTLVSRLLGSSAAAVNLLTPNPQ